MAEFVLKHVLAPHFFSGSASGLLMSGPTPDGAILMTFFRDGVRYASETYTYPDDAPDGPLQLSAPEYKSDVVREDVATISVPLAAFEEYVRVMNERLTLIRSQLNAQSST